MPDPQAPRQQATESTRSTLTPPPEGPPPKTTRTILSADTIAPAREPLARRIIGRTLGVCIVLGALALAAYVTRLYYIYPRTDDAYVRANIIGLAPHVSGPLVELPIQDNQHVKQGQLLFVVDPRPYQSGVASAQSEVSKAQNDLGQYGDINARRKAAEAALYDAKLNVEYCHVRAPFDAFVTNLNIAVGQYANEGREVMSLVDNRTWYVVANFRENFLGYIRPGMSVDVYLLSYPNKRFHGRVQGVGWALYQGNGASVQGLPQVEETLNWVRLSQRFPVRVILENADPAFPFRMGSTAVVTVRGNH